MPRPIGVTDVFCSAGIVRGSARESLDLAAGPQAGPRHRRVSWAMRRPVVARVSRTLALPDVIPLSKKSKGRARAAGRAAGRISIRDTGIGMDAGVVAALFQPFIQADNSTSRKYGGSGLGLVISRQIIDAMGGQISIQGTPGAGTEISFTITLAPAAAPVGNGTTAAPLREAAAALSTESIGTLHVLLVEDNPVNQFYCNTLLREMGHAVDPANDGEQAMEKVRARHARAHGQCDG